MAMKMKQMIIWSLVIITSVLGLNTSLLAKDEGTSDFEVEAVNLTGTWDLSGETFCSPGGYSTVIGFGTVTEQTGNAFKGITDLRKPLTGAINGNQVILNVHPGTLYICKLINSKKLTCLLNARQQVNQVCSARVVFNKR